MPAFFKTKGIAMYLDKINQIKQHMADLGWTIEEKIGSEGWSKNRVGYYIKFSRCEWHGKFTVSLTGHDVFFIGLAKNAFDYEEVLNIVHHTAKTARKAWHDFPTSIPYQNAKGNIIEDVYAYKNKSQTKESMIY